MAIEMHWQLCKYGCSVKSSLFFINLTSAGFSSQALSNVADRNATPELTWFLILRLPERHFCSFIGICYRTISKRCVLLIAGHLKVVLVSVAFKVLVLKVGRILLTYAIHWDWCKYSCSGKRFSSIKDIQPAHLKVILVFMVLVAAEGD